MESESIPEIMTTNTPENDEDPPQRPLVVRRCKECGRKYSPDFDHLEIHMNPPDNYSAGCGIYCLPCWLGVGPNDPGCEGTEYPGIYLPEIDSEDTQLKSGELILTRLGANPRPCQHQGFLK